MRSAKPRFGTCTALLRSSFVVTFSEIPQGVQSTTTPNAVSIALCSVLRQQSAGYFQLITCGGNKPHVPALVAFAW
jgi:hypothetical protein